MPSGRNRYELVRGDLIELAPTGDPHGIVVSRIHYALAHYVEQTRHGDIRVGETGYRLESDPDTVRGRRCGLGSAGPYSSWDTGLS